MTKSMVTARRTADPQHYVEGNNVTDRSQKIIFDKWPSPRPNSIFYVSKYSKHVIPCIHIRMLFGMLIGWYSDRIRYFIRANLLFRYALSGPDRTPLQVQSYPHICGTIFMSYNISQSHSVSPLFFDVHDSQ